MERGDEGVVRKHHASGVGRRVTCIRHGIGRGHREPGRRIKRDWIFMAFRMVGLHLTVYIIYPRESIKS